MGCIVYITDPLDRIENVDYDETGYLVQIEMRWEIRYRISARMQKTIFFPLQMPRLQDLENSISGAHFLKRHGAQTTLQSQYDYVKQGMNPTTDEVG
ncbi:hypothetical protein [Brevibacillus laterosporus]|uniref:hypothetical protein n=1 Tax=Brevibacillus laterosporus TaxID=1465 RepID=UPI003D1D163A